MDQSIIDNCANTAAQVPFVDGSIYGKALNGAVYGYGYRAADEIRNGVPSDPERLERYEATSVRHIENILFLKARTPISEKFNPVPVPREVALNIVETFKERVNALPVVTDEKVLELLARGGVNTERDQKIKRRKAQLAYETVHVAIDELTLMIAHALQGDASTSMRSLGEHGVEADTYTPTAYQQLTFVKKMIDALESALSRNGGFYSDENTTEDRKIELLVDMELIVGSIEEARGLELQIQQELDAETPPVQEGQMH